MRGILLAAGKGTRMLPGFSPARTVCKPLVDISGKKLIDYSMQLFRKSAIKDVTVTVNPSYTPIKNHLSENFGDFKVKYAVQAEQAGLVNALVAALQSVEDDILLELCDEIFFDCKIESFIDFFSNEPCDFLLSYTKEKDREKIKSNFSISCDRCGNVKSTAEKPLTAVNLRKGTGICIFNKACVDFLKKNYDRQNNKPKELCDFINLLVDNGFCGKAFRIASEEVNVNTPQDVITAGQLIKNGGKLL